MSKAKIGLIQVRQRECDGYRERTDYLYNAAEECFKEGADLVFFPEAYQYANDRTTVFDPAALTALNKEWKERCSTLAKKYHAYLVPWDYEYCDGKTYNSSYILDRNGIEIGRYRKVHLTRGESEGFELTEGDEFPVFELDFGKVGIMICWDNYFPESARSLYNNGAELVLYPLYGDTLIPMWEIKLRARAADNFMYIASSQIGNSAGVFTGITSPEGNVLVRLENKACHAVFEIDVGREVTAHTNGNPKYPEKLKDYVERCRRPEAYGAVLKKPQVNSWDDIYYNSPCPIVRRP